MMGKTAAMEWVRVGEQREVQGEAGTCTTRWMPSGSLCPSFPSLARCRGSGDVSAGLACEG